MDRTRQQQGNRKQRRAAAKLGGSAAPAADLAALYAEAVRQHQAGQLAAAEPLYRRILAADAQHAGALHLLGVLAHQIGRHDAAVELIGKAIAVDPRVAAFHSNLGLALKGSGRLEEAVAAFGRGLALTPGDHELHSNLGLALHEQGRFGAALAALEQAVALAPAHPVLHNNLGNLLKEQNRLVEAEAAYRHALRLAPDYAEAHGNLGILLQELGRLEEAIACHRTALDLAPGALAMRSNLLFALNYAGGDSAACLDAARTYGTVAQKAAGKRFSAWRCKRDPLPLRVGLVSGDLSTHPVSYFLEAVLRHIDPARIALIAYPTQTRADATTARLRALCAEWHPLYGLTDEAAAERIHADAVHVLIDLAGHTAGNRLPVFAWKPAPVQASWLGYFATTGLPEMDFLIADPHVVPTGEEARFSERLWRLPESYRCFTPPDAAAAVGALPALAAGAPTFGCFNNIAKLTDSTLAVWARILAALPGARLFLKAKQLADAAVCDAVRQRFAARGVAAERLVLEGPSPRAAMLEAYNRVDILLDPFPYPGGTTTMEALWMGVPPVTMRGRSMLSWGGASIAANAGLGDWIAEEEDAYVAKAVAAAADLPELARLRATLRAQVLASPLCDAPRFARHLEAALWGMWETR